MPVSTSQVKCACRKVTVTLCPSTRGGVKPRRTGSLNHPARVWRLRRVHPISAYSFCITSLSRRRETHVQLVRVSTCPDRCAQGISCRCHSHRVTHSKTFQSCGHIFSGTHFVTKTTKRWLSSTSGDEIEDVTVKTQKKQQHLV